MFAHRGLGAQMAIGACDELNGAAERVGAVHGGRWSGEDFHAIEADQWSRNFAIVVAALRVVEPDAIKQDQCLSESGAAKAEVGLDVTSTTGSRVDPWQQPQPVDQRRRADQEQVLAGEAIHRAPDGIGWYRRGRGGDDHLGGDGG